MASLTKGPPSTRSSMPIIRPSARISRMKLNLEASLVSPSRNSAPRARIFSRSSSSSMISRNSRATAHEFLDIIEDEELLENIRARSEEHTSELQSHLNLVCRLLLEKKKTNL